MNQNIADLVIFDGPISSNVFKVGNPVVIVDFQCPGGYDSAYNAPFQLVGNKGVVKSIRETEQCLYSVLVAMCSDGTTHCFHPFELAIDEKMLLLKDWLMWLGELLNVKDKE